MLDHIHPADLADALQWAVKHLQESTPADQLDRNRVHILQQLRDAAVKEARK